MSDDSPITGDTPFRVGDWHVDPATGRVKSAAAEVKLEPKVMAVLVCLARQPGKVVTREQLEATVWAGVVVGYDSLASTIIKLRKAFGDDSKQPRIIETVPKRGYRLIAGVGPVQREAGVEPEEKPPAPSTTWVVTGLVTTLLLLGVAVWLYMGSRQPVPDPGVEQAVAIDAELPQVYWALGLTQMFGKDYKQALSTAEKSIALNPNYADGYGLLATILNYAGRPRQALALMQKAMRLNPRHPFAYNVIRGEIYFNLHSYDSAVDDFMHALERNPDAYEPRLWLAAAYAHLGRADDAGWELEQIRNSGAEISLDHIERVIPLKDPVQRKHLIDGLSKAGLTHRQTIR